MRGSTGCALATVTAGVLACGGSAPERGPGAEGSSSDGSDSGGSSAGEPPTGAGSSEGGAVIDAVVIDVVAPTVVDPAGGSRLEVRGAGFAADVVVCVGGVEAWARGRLGAP